MSGILDDQSLLRATHGYARALGGNVNEAEHGSDAIWARMELERELESAIEEAIDNRNREELDAMQAELEEAEARASKLEEERDEARALLKRMKQMLGDVTELLERQAAA